VQVSHGLASCRACSPDVSLSSIPTPFALGAMVGAITAGRVPVGNAAGDPFPSWLNATLILVGLLADEGVVDEKLEVLQ
jgi:hypothetical protein